MTILAHLPLLLAAISSPAPAHRAPAPSAAPPACAAVTRTDVEQALGMPIAQGQPQDGRAVSGCDYEAGQGLVTITIQRLKFEPDLRAEIESLKASIPQSAVRSAPGIGKRAFFLDIAGAGTQLHVIRGEYAVLVSVLGLGGPAQVSEAAMALARRACEKL